MSGYDESGRTHGKLLLVAEVTCGACGYGQTYHARKVKDESPCHARASRAEMWARADGWSKSRAAGWLCAACKVRRSGTDGKDGTAR